MKRLCLVKIFEALYGVAQCFQVESFFAVHLLQLTQFRKKQKEQTCVAQGGNAFIRVRGEHYQVELIFYSLRGCQTNQVSLLMYGLNQVMIKREIRKRCEMTHCLEHSKGILLERLPPRVPDKSAAYVPKSAVGVEHIA